MTGIAALFDKLLDRGGSDLHLGVGYPPLLRARGELVPLREAPSSPKRQSFFERAGALLGKRGS